MARLLYVEDDINLGYVTRYNLEQEGFEVVHCENGTDALEHIQNGFFQLCILDVMLPGIDGFTLSEKIREVNKEIPLIFLTAKNKMEDRIRGLKLGGDDYISKPYNIEELILKIRVFLRRSDIQVSSPKYTIGNLEFDYKNLTLNGSGSTQVLTRKEAELLRYLFINRNLVVKREDILTKVWGKDDYFLGRSLDVFISKLRKYIASEGSVSIENHHGVGFKLNLTEINSHQQHKLHK